MLFGYDFTPWLGGWGQWVLGGFIASVLVPVTIWGTLSWINWFGKPQAPNERPKTSLSAPLEPENQNSERSKVVEPEQETTNPEKDSPSLLEGSSSQQARLESNDSPEMEASSVILPATNVKKVRTAITNQIKLKKKQISELKFQIEIRNEDTERIFDFWRKGGATEEDIRANSDFPLLQENEDFRSNAQAELHHLVEDVLRLEKYLSILEDIMPEAAASAARSFGRPSQSINYPRTRPLIRTMPEAAVWAARSFGRPSQSSNFPRTRLLILTQSPDKTKTRSAGSADSQIPRIGSALPRIEEEKD